MLVTYYMSMCARCKKRFFPNFFLAAFLPQWNVDTVILWIIFDLVNLIRYICIHNFVVAYIENCLNVVKSACLKNRVQVYYIQLYYKWDASCPLFSELNTWYVFKWEREKKSLIQKLLLKRFCSLYHTRLIFFKTLQKYLLSTKKQNEILAYIHRYLTFKHWFGIMEK